MTSSCQGCCSTGKQLPFPSSVVDLRLHPRTSRPKLLQPPLWLHSFIHSGSSVSGPCNPRQSMQIHERARGPAVLYERRKRNNWHAAQQSEGGRTHYGDAEREMRYYGESRWMAFRSCSPHGDGGSASTSQGWTHVRLMTNYKQTHPMRVWATTSKEKKKPG